MRMSTPRTLLLCTALGLGVMIGCILKRQPPDPVYNGKRLSKWLDGYAPTGLFHYDSIRNADEAVAHLGTNCIPLLLKMLQKKDFPLQAQVAQFLWSHQVTNFQPRWASGECASAMLAFQKLGPDGKDAVPDLIKIYQANPDVRGWILGCLGAIGPAAEKADSLLVRATKGTNSLIRVYAVNAISKVHAEPDTMVPLLSNLLSDPDIDVEGQAAFALGQFGEAARPAIPMLRKTAKNPDKNLSQLAKQALQRIEGPLLDGLEP